jgi:MFS family permease
VGVLVGCYALGLFAFAWPLARVVPRIGPRLAMVLGTLGLMLCTAAFMWATSFLGLVAARTLQGVAAAMTWTAGPMALASTTAPTRRGRVMGLAMLGSGLGTLCGPPVGGWLFERGGIALPFAFSMALCVLLLCGVVFAVPIKLAPRKELPLRLVSTHPRVRLVALIILTASGILTLLEPVLPLYLNERFGLAPSEIGLAFGAAVLCYALAAGPAGALADRFGRVRTAGVGLLLSALLLPFIAFWGSALGVVGALGLLGAASAFSLTPTMAAMADALDLVEPGTDTDYASVYAIYNAAYAVGMWLGPVLGAGLTHEFGLGVALAVAAVPAAGCSLLAVRG